MITALFATVSRRTAGALAAIACSTIVPVQSQSAPRHTGSITGSVRLATPVRGRPLAAAAYATRTVHQTNLDFNPDLSRVVVYLKDAPSTGNLPAMRAEIRQRGEQFEPRVVAITRGSTVDFPNFDPYFHNVFSLSGIGPFDLGRYSKGQSRSRQFRTPGLVKVFCHLHSHMSAAILVFDHPYFTTADASGTFSLPIVPEGRYRLAAWHERAGETDVSLTVEAGRLVTTTLDLPVVEP